eukprot:6456850-Amphidinium_carterae.1
MRRPQVTPLPRDMLQCLYALQATSILHRVGWNWRWWPGPAMCKLRLLLASHLRPRRPACPALPCSFSLYLCKFRPKCIQQKPHREHTLSSYSQENIVDTPLSALQHDRLKQNTHLLFGTLHLSALRPAPVCQLRQTSRPQPTPSTD